MTHEQYENKKNENSDEVKRYGYCNFNGIKHGPLFTYVDGITGSNRNEYQPMPLDIYEQFANDWSSHQTEQRAKEEATRTAKKLAAEKAAAESAVKQAAEEAKKRAEHAERIAMRQATVENTVEKTASKLKDKFKF